MAGQPLYDNYMGLDQIKAALGGSQGFGTQGNDPAQAEAGVKAISGLMTPDNPWYAQNFGLGGSIPSFVENIYQKYYGRAPDEAGAKFWGDKANDYQTAGTADTKDDRSAADTQAWLMTHFLGRSNEFSNKYGQEQAAYGGKKADYKDAADWQGYHNNAGMQRQALNRMPGVMDPASLGFNQQANKSMMYPAKLQQGGVDRVVAGGVNIAPILADAQEAAGKPRDTSGAAQQQDMAGLLNYMVNSGFDEATITKAMAAIKDAANLNKGLYMRNPMSGNAAAATAAPAASNYAGNGPLDPMAGYPGIGTF